MKYVLAALLILSACGKRQQVTGPWEMWVLVSLPGSSSVWHHGENVNKKVMWAAVPGTLVKGVLIRNGEVALFLFDWMEKTPGEYTFTYDIAGLQPGTGYRVMIEDDQGFYGLSDVFSVEADSQE